MKGICLSGCIVFLITVGCGPQYYLKGDDTKPGKVVVSAYTQEGCKEELEKEAGVHGVKVKLTDIESDLGWGIFL